MQFFGHVQIEGKTGRMTVTLRDRADGRALVDDARSEAGLELSGSDGIRTGLQFLF